MQTLITYVQYTNNEYTVTISFMFVIFRLQYKCCPEDGVFFERPLGVLSWVTPPDNGTIGGGPSIIRLCGNLMRRIETGGSF